MSNSRRAALLAAACSFGLMAGLVSAAQAETLADALALAYQTNPTLLQQRATARYTDEGIVQAKTAFRPTASVSMTATDSRSDPIGSKRTNSGSSTATLSIVQPLYTGGRASANLSAAEGDALAARETLRSVEQQIVLSVLQAYVNVRRDMERLRIYQENVSVLARQLEESQARFDVGEITRTDVALSQARLSEAKASLASAQAQLETSRAAYVAIVGQTPGDLAPEPSLASLLPKTVDEAFDAADRNNPSVQSARYTEAAYGARVAAAKAGYRPTVSARGSLGYTASQVGNIGDRYKDYDRATSATVTATVPLFQGGLIVSEVRQAVERESVARAAVEVAKRSAIRSAAGAWASYLAAQSNVISTQDQVKASALAYEGVKQEQQVGLRTTTEVLNAQQELRVAELALAVARADEYSAAATVLQAMGTMDVSKLAQVQTYDPDINKKSLSWKIGWVPWEPAVQLIDKVGAASTKPKSK